MSQEKSKRGGARKGAGRPFLCGCPAGTRRHASGCWRLRRSTGIPRAFRSSALLAPTSLFTENVIRPLAPRMGDRQRDQGLLTRRELPFLKDQYLVRSARSAGEEFLEVTGLLHCPEQESAVLQLHQYLPLELVDLLLKELFALLVYPGL